MIINSINKINNRFEYSLSFNMFQIMLPSLYNLVKFNFSLKCMKIIISRMYTSLLTSPHRRCKWSAKDGRCDNSAFSHGNPLTSLSLWYGETAAPIDNLSRPLIMWPKRYTALRDSFTKRWVIVRQLFNWNY